MSNIEKVREILQKHYSDAYPVVEEPEEDIEAIAVVHASNAFLYKSIAEELAENGLYVQAIAEISDNYDITVFIGEIP